MANHTITLTTDQEKALALAVEEFNAPLLLQSPPGNTRDATGYLEYLLTPHLDSMVQRAPEIRVAEIVKKAKEAFTDNVKMAAVEAALGISAKTK